MKGGLFGGGGHSGNPQDFVIQDDDNSPIATAQPGATDEAPLYASLPAMTIDPEKRYVATIKTGDGEIQVELYADQTPETVNNFVFLARLIGASVGLRRQQERAVALHGLVERAHGLLAAHEQRHHHVREDDDVAQGEQRNRQQAVLPLPLVLVLGVAPAVVITLENRHSGFSYALSA